MVRFRFHIPVFCASVFVLCSCSSTPQIDTTTPAVPADLTDDFQIALLIADAEDLASLHSSRSVPRWLNQFWDTRDPLPTSPENEALQVFRQRLRWIRSSHSPVESVLDIVEPWKSFLIFGPPSSHGAELTNGSLPWVKTFIGPLERPIPGVIYDRYEFDTPSSFTLVFRDTSLVVTRGRYPPAIPPALHDVWKVLEDPDSGEGLKIRALLNLSWYELPSVLQRVLHIPEENFTRIEEYRERALHSLAVRSMYLLGQDALRRFTALRTAGGTDEMILERVISGTYSAEDLEADLARLLNALPPADNPVVQYLHPGIRSGSDALFADIAREYASDMALTGWDWRGDVTLALGKPDWFNPLERTAITLWNEPEEYGVGDISPGVIERIQFTDTISCFTQFSTEKLDTWHLEAESATEQLARTLAKSEQGLLLQTNLTMLEQLHVISPPETYEVEVPVGCRTLPITMDATAFSAGPDSLDLQVTFGVPARALSISVLDGKQSTSLEVSLKLFSRERELVWTSLRQGGYQIEGQMNDPSALVMDTFRFRIPIGSYVIYLSARDPDVGMNGGVLSYVETASGATTGLQASPILLAGDIIEEDGTGKFHRGGYRVLPAPSRHFIFGYDIHCYFEIMKLQQSEFGDYLWNESYFFIPDTPGEGIIRISTGQDYQRVRSDISRRITLNTDAGVSSTYEGPVFLVVLITDRISGAQTVTATRFYINRN